MASSHGCHKADEFRGLRIPWKLRLEYAGAIYHVMNRANRRETIFRGKAAGGLFLAPLTEVCGKTHWQVNAYCLTSNHFQFELGRPTIARAVLTENE
jgi:hypothetical protein